MLFHFQGSSPSQLRLRGGPRAIPVRLKARLRATTLFNLISFGFSGRLLSSCSCDFIRFLRWGCSRAVREQFRFWLNPCLIWYQGCFRAIPEQRKRRSEPTTESFQDSIRAVPDQLKGSFWSHHSFKFSFEISFNRQCSFSWLQSNFRAIRGRLGSKSCGSVAQSKTYWSAAKIVFASSVDFDNWPGKNRSGKSKRKAKQTQTKQNRIKNIYIKKKKKTKSTEAVRDQLNEKAGVASTSSGGS